MPANFGRNSIKWQQQAQDRVDRRDMAKYFALHSRLCHFWRIPWNVFAATSCGYMKGLDIFTAGAGYDITADLAAWMKNMDLDFNDEERLSNVEPLDMIVRCSLDLGVPAVVSLELQEEAFYQGKRVIKLDLSEKEKKWLNDRLQRSEHVNANDYARLLALYGVQPRRYTELAANLSGYEKELRNIINRNPEKDPRFVAINSIPVKFRKPYNAEDQWVKAFSKYTSNTYMAVDPLLCKDSAVNVLVDVIHSESLGEKGLRYLIAWSVYTQLVQYTVPDLLLDKKTAEEACYAHVDKAMHLALVSPYLLKVVPSMLQAAKAMVSSIHNSFHDILESSWVRGHDRSIVLQKLKNMKTYVGSPGRRLEPKFVEAYYGLFPDVPRDRLFPTWIKALGISSHYLWSDQTTWLYDETEVNAQYVTPLNTLIVPTAIISRPLYNHRVPEALNYGALGTIVGHEMMHAYDVRGIEYDEEAAKWFWRSAAFMREYTKRTLCLRRSHRAAERQKARSYVDHAMDSENMADFVGVRTAYKAFSALPERKRTQTLVGTNITSERLFFIAHCVKWCAERNAPEPYYSPFRFRCMVPLMNMPEFSNAFGCAAGENMNPPEKCDFWQ
ncbi:endothelin-converting enzyme 2-like [Rhipicephalus microplus]|uniref:endothelin-converting enzyme 2-like n=1 Tax=Rhipicephalus microplus TaxID=6941 RepID=UPI003F6C1C02